MVRVSMLAGPYAGQVIEAPFGLVTPQDILCGIAGYRHEWNVDYTDATVEERDLWESQELSLKLVRALAAGATISFLGKEYHSHGVAGAFEAAAEIEESLLESGKTAYFEAESSDRILLGAR
ncbi:MAG: hypothetical protein IPL87_01230 [Candidatus Moraniibacteriota bacterium]|nr:MAG: hypothetical protein IPL87_01230 [Candidatus Moranbacteria bacterium]